MWLKEVKLECAQKLIQHPSCTLSVEHQHSWQEFHENIISADWIMDIVGGYYSSTDPDLRIEHRHRANTVTVLNDRRVTNPLDIATLGKSREYYKGKASIAARKFDGCRISSEEPPKEITFRTRTSSFSSYFLKTSKFKDEKPRMKGTEEFWNQYRRKSSGLVSLSSLMKQILFPSQRIKISSFI